MGTTKNGKEARVSSPTAPAIPYNRKRDVEELVALGSRLAARKAAVIGET
eukprot:evm.model.NODE_31407_length_6906_cov_18.941210.4